MERSGQDLVERSITAAFWGVGGSAIRMLVQLGAQIAIARILGPEQVGLFAVAFVVISLCTFVAEVGLSYGLIQRKSVVDHDIRFVFTWQLILGLLMSGSLLLLAGQVAIFVGDERIAPVIQVLAVAPAVSMLGATSSALLRRGLDFKSLQIAALAGAMAFAVTGVSLAILGGGVYAMAAAFLAQVSVGSAVMLQRAGHPMMPLMRHPDAVRILGFSGTVLLTNLVNWIVFSLDRIVVGRAMSVAAAGLYSAVHTLVTAPTAQALTVIQSVLYSASASVQESRRSLRQGFRTMIGVVALFAAPPFFAAAMTAETIIAATYGDGWNGAADVLRPLAIAMPAYMLMGMAVPALWASGNERREFQLQIPIAIGWAVLLAGIAQLGSLKWLSWAVCALFYVRAVVIIEAACRALRFRHLAIWRQVRGAAVVTLIVGVSAAASDAMLAALGIGSQLRLLLTAVVCALVMGVSIHWLRRTICKEVRRLIGRVASRLPSKLGSFVSFVVLKP